MLCEVLVQVIISSFSKILLIKLRSDAGKYLSTFRLSPFLITGDTAPDFYLIGNFLWCFTFLKILFRVTAVCLPVLWKKIDAMKSVNVCFSIVMSSIRNDSLGEKTD